jgi:hypothetical protein
VLSTASVKASEQLVISASPKDFPVNVVTNILSYANLTPPELLRVRGVSRNWRDGAGADELWRLHSPTPSSQGLPLLDAFVKRRECCSHTANVFLLKVYESSSSNPKTLDRDLVPLSYWNVDLEAAWLVHQDPSLKLMSPPILNDAYLAGFAMAKKGSNLQFAARKTYTPANIHAALSNNGQAIRFLPKSMRANPAYAQTAMDQDGYTYLHLTEDLKARPDYAKKYLLKFAPTAQEIPESIFGDRSVFDLELLLSLRSSHSRDAIIQRIHVNLANDYDFLIDFVTAFPKWAYYSHPECFLAKLRPEMRCLFESKEFVFAAWQLAPEQEKRSLQKRLQALINSEQTARRRVVDGANFSDYTSTSQGNKSKRGYLAWPWNRSLMR